MSKNFRSMLDEMSAILPEKDKHLIVESKANHIIASAINILDMIQENFSEEEADDLSRRFLLAIRNKNPKKFDQGIKKLREKKDDK